MLEDLNNLLVTTFPLHIQHNPEEGGIVSQLEAELVSWCDNFSSITL